MPPRPPRLAAPARPYWLLEAEQIDLVFTDVVMPGPLDGFRLARWVAARWPHVEAIGTSGVSERLTRQLGPTASSGRMLSKPYNKE